jgi:hypothetical protein
VAPSASATRLVTGSIAVAWLPAIK